MAGARWSNTAKYAPAAVQHLLLRLQQNIGNKEALNEMRWMHQALKRSGRPRREVFGMLKRRLTGEPLPYVLGETHCLNTHIYWL